MLDPRRLRVLVELGRQGSIAAAAESLSFVPSAVSQQIAGLERELGVELTTRVGRGTALTSAGRLLVEHAEELLEQLARAEDAVRQLADAGSGQLRVAAFASAGATIVAGALGELARQHPGLVLSLAQQDSAHSIEALKRHEVDVAVIHRAESERRITAEPSVVERQLVRDELRLVVARSHPLASKRRASARELADDSWVLAPHGTQSHALALEAFRAARFHPTIAHTSDDHLVTLRLVAAGLGVALVPALALRGLDEPVAVVALDAAPARVVLAVWREQDRSEAVRVLVELLERQARRRARR